MNGLISQRVGFWRAQFDVLVASIISSLLVYGLAWVAGPPWAEILSVAGLGVYCWGGWRLAPGTGSLWRRAGRVAAWILLCALLGGVAGWGLTHLLSYPRPFFGSDPSQFRIGLGLAVLTSLLIVVPLAAFGRMIALLQTAAQQRLQWRLTFGFVVIGVVTTLLVYLAIGLYLGLYSVVVDTPIADPLRAAERLSSDLQPLVEQGDTATLQTTFEQILAGTTRIPTTLQRGELDPSLDGLWQLALIRFEDDQRYVLVTAAVAEQAQAYPQLTDLERFRLPLITARAQQACVLAQPARGTIPDSAICPIDAEHFLLVETLAAIESAQAGALIGRVLGVVSASLAASLGGLFLAGTVVLVVASLLGFGLARRTTRRIERIAAATQALAGGQRQLISDARPDELGALATYFNQMAAQLAEREAALMVERDRAERLLATNRRMVANISHELRTPLATLRGYLEALEQSHAAVLPTHDMQVIQSETDRLTLLIDDLFTLTRAEARQLPLQPEAIMLQPFVQRLVDTLAPLARRQRSLEVLANLPEEPLRIWADPARLEQILLNLLQNALRHTPPGGIIVVEAQAEPAHVAIAVADTGVGIEPADLPHIFERFYRGDTSRARETGGAGLGLALVRELTEAMGGSVTATSQVGRGSRFTIRLPHNSERSLPVIPSVARNPSPTERDSSVAHAPAE
ncbi:MAG: hypothetical protein OHK0050_42740 [Roseiflexaceae bacterium]